MSDSPSNPKWQTLNYPETPVTLPQVQTPGGDPKRERAVQVFDFVSRIVTELSPAERPNFIRLILNLLAQEHAAHSMQSDVQVNASGSPRRLGHVAPAALLTAPMATSVLQAAQQMPGPVKEQKPFYSARSDRRQKASEFLEEHWKAEIDAGLIYRFHIQRYDPSLINALTYEFKGKPDELRRILPSKRDEVSRRYEELAKR